MKILLVADLHYALKQFDWLLSEAPHYDVVVMAGDFLDLSSLATLEAQIVVVNTYLKRIAEKTQLVVCSGNHDLEAEEEGERVASWIRSLGGTRICRDGQHVLTGNTLISALPWWDGPLTKTAVRDQLARDAEARPEAGSWIWAHHAPPADSGLSWGGSRSYGDSDLVQWIEAFRPDIVFSGHVHQAPFISDGAWADQISGAWCFNMGQQPGPIPSHIAVSLEADEAIWLSQMGLSRVSLSGHGSPTSLDALPDWF
ncbi:phosphohydrolase [Rhodobacterales bacterium HKCCSP123]|nr:phosphohydrolase [Rhodobacterales bacterium HKCCSP123]